MSTVAEHLALLHFFYEMKYDRNEENRRFSGFTNEASMFCEVHLKELIAEQPVDRMIDARLDVEKRLREQHPAVAERLISAWYAAMVERPMPGADRERAITGEPVASSELGDHFDLIEAVLKGYPKSMARDDALNSMRLLRAASRDVAAEGSLEGPNHD